MDRRSGWALIVCAAVSAMPLGCAQSTRPLSADLFAPPSLIDPPHDHYMGHDMGQDAAPDPSSASVDLATPTRAIILTPLQPLDPGAIEPLESLDNAATNISKTDAAASAGEPAAQPASAMLSPSPAVSPAVSPAISIVSLQASPAPVPGTSLGVYTTLGTLMATVDGTPIYSSQVLHRLEKEFIAKAREDSEQEFRDFARGEIIRQRDELIQDEMIFRLSLNLLDEKDRQFAEAITINLKQKKITAAGGSLEAAKRQAAAEGENLDDTMTRTYREIVRDLVDQKVIEPMVHIGQDDLHKFYIDNVDKLYSEKSRALFRVIQIDPAALSGPNTDQLALQKITAIHEKAATGAEFVALASKENTDSYLKAHGGDPGGWMEANTYRIDALEKAVWMLQPGEVTPIVKADGIYYIARLFDKKIGVTRSFDDPDVQSDMYNRLRQQQVSEQWDLIREQTQSAADVVAPDDRVDLAVDLAVQQFHPQSASVAAADSAGR